MNPDQVLEFLKVKNDYYKEQGSVPTLDLLIEDLEKQHKQFIEEINGMAKNIN